MPVGAVTVAIAIRGLFTEIEVACEAMIRPLGHAGMMIGFLACAHSHMSGTFASNVSCCIVAFMSFSCALFITMPYVAQLILLLSGLWMLRFAYTFSGMVCLYVLVVMHDEWPALDATEGFATAGHITILSAVACCQSFAFLVSSVLLFLIAVERQSFEMAAMSLVAAVAFVIEKRPTHVMERFAWTSRRLWDCPQGWWITLSLMCYAVGIVCVRSDCGVDPLFTLHVGAIVVSCALIYPQAAPKTHGLFKSVLCAASGVDSALGALLAYRQRDPVQALRAGFALTTCLGLAAVVPHDEVVYESLPLRTTTTDWRLMGVAYYIVVFFVLRPVDQLVGLAHLTHFCFIIGGIACEAIVQRDRLMRDIVIGLVSAQAVGLIATDATVAHASAIISLCLCLPWKGVHSQQSTLTF